MHSYNKVISRTGEKICERNFFGVNINGDTVRYVKVSGKKSFGKIVIDNLSCSGMSL